MEQNTLSGYIETLCNMINQPFPKYEEIGTKYNGQYLQLNTNLLQIENEYYSVIRPKRRTLPLEKPTTALSARGVEYLEVRCLDLDPFNPIGISENQARFLDLFLIFCLLEPSAPMTAAQQEAMTSNKDAVVLTGRKPDLHLQQNGASISPREWGAKIMAKLEGIAQVFDSALGGNLYRIALQEQHRKIDDPSQTPSAKIVAHLLANDEPFFSFAIRMAEQVKQTFTAQSLSQSTLDRYSQTAEQSIAEQRKLEQSDSTNFDTFLARYFSQ